MIESIFLQPWVWIIPVVLVLAVGVTVWAGVRIRKHGELDAGPEAFIGMMFGVATFLGLGGFYFGWMLPPYDTSYYQTYRITGELESVESAFSGDEGTMSQTFVAQVKGVDYFIRSDDQRFRTLEAGDDVNLVCGKGFAYFQEPWYDCSFGG